MSKIPYPCLLISIFTSLVMWIVYRWRLRKVERASRVRFERLIERIRIALERHDTMLQTIEAAKFVADDALERPDDIAYMRGALGKLSRWLGQATQEAQLVLKSLSSSIVEKQHD